VLVCYGTVLLYGTLCCVSVLWYSVAVWHFVLC